MSEYNCAERMSNIFKFAFGEQSPSIGVNEENKISLHKFDTHEISKTISFRKYNLGKISFVNAPFDYCNERYEEQTISQEDFSTTPDCRIMLSCNIDYYHYDDILLLSNDDVKSMQSKAYSLADRFINGLNYMPLFFNMYEEINDNEFLLYYKVMFLMVDHVSDNIFLEFNIFNEDIINHESFRQGISSFIKKYAKIHIEPEFITEENIEEVIMQFRSTFY